MDQYIASGAIKLQMPVNTRWNSYYDSNNSYIKKTRVRWLQFMIHKGRNRR